MSTEYKQGEPLRICHLFTSQETGGLEKHVQEQCRWQVQNTSAQVCVVAHPRYRKLFASEVRFIALDTDRGRRNPLFLLALLRTLRQEHFDLVHGHGGKPAYLLQKLQPLLRGRCVITRHNAPNPKDGIARHFPQRIAVSHKAVEDSALDWRVIPNGTQLPADAGSLPEQLQPGRPAVIAVARLVAAKGIDLLLQAWGDTARGEAQLYIVGDGPERTGLEALAKELGIADSVKFVGFSPQVASWYRAADLLVISSRYEGGPYTVAEALLSGCPVVSTDVGYVAENIPARWLARDLNPPTLAALLTEALGDLGALRESYRESIARAAGRLTLEAMAADTWRVYQRALA
ncbi:glycosyltransferase [Microbulbifer sp. TYP-18]|uniref:glycosyltransferase n=1 Tax=Microbulbifer sp. TYP-18 TaxID=3230024 RepID=UPI0034C63715